MSGIKHGYFVRAANATEESPLGAEVSNSNWSCTEFIEVKPNTNYVSTLPYFLSAGSAGLVFYDKNKNAILGITAQTQGNAVYAFTTPNDCAFVRFSWYHINGDNAQLELGSTATTYEPYQQSNEIAISFPAVGHNQWDEEWVVGIIDGNGNYQSTGGRVVSKNFIPIFGGVSYYSTLTGGWVYFYDENQNKLSNVNLSTNVFNTPAKARYMKFYTPSTYGDTYNHDISINYPATFTTYEPYTNTVYGGTLDVEKGELTVNMAMVDLGSCNYTLYHGFFYATVSNIKKAGLNEKGNIKCSEYPTVTYNEVYNNSKIGIAQYSGQNRIAIYDPSYITASEFKTAMNGVQLVYELATPITISLTPEQVQLLKGHNTIWTDGDVIKLIYKP